jgi:hypothetical protein
LSPLATTQYRAGRLGLAQHRRAICRLLWQEWSPTWRFDEATFDRTASSFDNPDFVPVVIHSYHHHGNASGDPRFERSSVTSLHDRRSPFRGLSYME